MSKLGGGMRHVDEIRGDGVAPVPAADACLHSHKDGPNTRRPHQSSRAAGSHQPKNAREFEGSALIGAEGPVSSSLDLLQSNRNSQPNWRTLQALEPIERPRWLNALGRRGFCGKAVAVGTSLDSSEVRFARINCKCWACPYCGPKKAKRYRCAVRENAQRLKLNRFLTLTLDPSKIEGDPVRYLRGVFNEFRVYLRRKFGVAPQYIAVLEFQKSGNPHLHILLDRYIERNWIAQTWSAIGGGRIVDIRFVDIGRISNYVSKYLTKELLLSAPLGSRRVTTSRGIQLLEKPKKTHHWEFLKTPVFHCAESLWPYVEVLEIDEDGILSNLRSISRSPEDA
jgi:hypothetical protein